jgi:hypothetical protein
MPHIDRQRRRFIGQSITGAAVAALSAQPLFATQATSEDCGFISKSDWLVNGLGFVTEISAEAFQKIVKVATSELVSYETAFDELYCLLEALSAELAKSPNTAQSTVGRLETLAQVAHTNSEFVRVALRERENPAPLFLTLALVSQGVCAEAQRIPAAEKEWTLSKEATGILKKIVELATSDRFLKLQENVGKAEATTNKETAEVNSLVSTLHMSVSNARKAILLSENPHPKNDRGEAIMVDKSMQWRRYHEELTTALGALKTLTLEKGVFSFLPQSFRHALPEVVMSQDEVKAAVVEAATASAAASSEAGLTAADALILGLGTCRRDQQSARFGNGDEFRFVKASYTSPAPFVDRNAIGNLLWSHCPPGSRDQIDKVDSVVAFVGGWNSWIPAVARAALIGSGLYWANKAQRITCSGVRDLRRLAEGLSQLV